LPPPGETPVAGRKMDSGSTISSIHAMDSQRKQMCLSATVVAPSARTAEMAAKVALILAAGGLFPGWIKRPSLPGYWVLEDGEILHSRRWMNIFLEVMMTKPSENAAARETTILRPTCLPCLSRPFCSSWLRRRPAPSARC